MNKIIENNENRGDVETLDKLSEHFLSSLKPSTRKAYSVDLVSLSAFLGTHSVSETAVLFVSLPQGKANLTALEWRTHLREQDLAPSSINRRLAALRSLVSFARMLGIINYELSVKNYKATTYRDVRGPGQSAFNKMFEYISSKRSKQFVRDKAILVLFHDLGLRRAELSQLNYEDLYMGDVYSVAVSAKGRDDKQLLTIPFETFKSLKDWIDLRGDKKGPLFTSLDRAKKGNGRLSPGAIYERIRSIGKSIGIETHPHALRHLAITEACKLAQANGIGLEEVLNFSRHSNVNTLMIYRDKERDVQGKISELLSKLNK